MSNITHSNPGGGPLGCLIPLLVILAAFVILAGVGIGATLPDSGIVQMAESQDQVEIAALPKNEQERALDKIAEVAMAGDAAIVAVAVSGDNAQVSIVRNQTMQLWAVAAIFISIAVVVVIRSKGSNKA